MKLFLKGERCLTEKCAIERRAYPPGEHGRGRTKQSEYLLQLREKQKARRYYGILERQFRTYYEQGQQAHRHHRREPAADARAAARQRRRTGWASPRRVPRPGQLVRARPLRGQRQRASTSPATQVAMDDVVSIRETSAGQGRRGRRDRSDRLGLALAAGRPRQSHGQGAACARSGGHRHARDRNSSSSSLLEVIQEG